MKNIGKEIKLAGNYYNTTIGTVNRKNTSSIYAEFSTFITPTDSNVVYKDELFRMQKEIRKTISVYCAENEAISNKFICDFDIPIERVKFGKKCYLSMQVYFLLENTQIFSNIVSPFSLSVSGLFEKIRATIESNGFSCNKEKN